MLRVAPGGEIVEAIAAPDGMGVFACALGGDDGRELLMCCAPDFYEHTRAPVREAVLVSTRSPSRTPACRERRVALLATGGTIA